MSIDTGTHPKLHWKRDIAYLLATTTFAAWQALDQYGRDTGAMLWGDTHGPDPGSTEYIAAVRWMNENAWGHAAGTFLGIQIVLLLPWAVLLAVRIADLLVAQRRRAAASRPGADKPA